MALDLEDYRPSVLLHCWLDHLTCKIVSEMTYNVSSGTLNPTIPYNTILLSVFPQSGPTMGWMNTFHEILFFPFFVACDMLHLLCSRSNLIFSIHLFRSLNLLLLPGNRVCNARSGSRSSCILPTCPYHLSLPHWIFSITVSFFRSLFLISVFLRLSLLLTPSNRLNQPFGMLKFFAHRFFLIVQHFALYNRTDSKPNSRTVSVLCPVH